MKKLIAITSVGLGFLFTATSAFAADEVITIKKPDNLPLFTIEKIIGSIISISLMLATVAAFVFLIWGGIQWITSGGDKAGVESAQHRIQAALLGLLIVISTWAIFTLIENFLGIQLFQFTLKSPVG